MMDRVSGTRGQDAKGIGCSAPWNFAHKLEEGKEQICGPSHSPRTCGRKVRDQRTTCVFKRGGTGGKPICVFKRGLGKGETPVCERKGGKTTTTCVFVNGGPLGSTSLHSPQHLRMSAVAGVSHCEVFQRERGADMAGAGGEERGAGQENDGDAGQAAA